MWVVAKIKIKELNIFKEKLTKKFGHEVKFYHPKIECHEYCNNKIKKIKKPILENYILCHHDKFKKFNTLPDMKYLKGLIYFLNGCEKNQKELINFIEHCKSYENKDGYLTSGFFENMMSERAKFISGPFTNMIFKILERKKNKLKILVGNIVTTISDRKNYLYCPI